MTLSKMVQMKVTLSEAHKAGMARLNRTQGAEISCPLTRLIIALGVDYQGRWSQREEGAVNMDGEAKLV